MTMSAQWQRLRDKPSAVEYLGLLLENGSLGLLLGAGASKQLGLPTWNELVERCMIGVPPNSLSGTGNTDDLTRRMDAVKSYCAANGIDYLDKVKQALYQDITLDFQTAKKELLIALSSLVVGRHRGCVSSILNLNFDSVLEWYFHLMGLRLEIVMGRHQIGQHSDVRILHPHGFLPHSNHNVSISGSSNIVLSWTEMSAFQMGDTFQKALMLDFFRTRAFLSVGVGVETLVDGVCKYPATIKDEPDFRNRQIPFGFAIIRNPIDPVTEGRWGNFQSVSDTLFSHGIIAIPVEAYEEIPHVIFEVAKGASIPRSTGVA